MKKEEIKKVGARSKSEKQNRSVLSIRSSQKQVSTAIIAAFAFLLVLVLLAALQLANSGLTNQYKLLLFLIAVSASAAPLKLMKL